MARARSGGSPSAAWAITLLGAGFFICGILAALFFAQKGGVEEELATAQRDLNEIATATDRNSPEVQAARQEPGSVVSVLLARASEAQTNLDTANRDLASRTAEKENLENQLANTSKALEDAQQKVAVSTSEKETIRRTFQDQAAAMTAKVDAAEKANTRLQEDLESMRAQLQGDQREARVALENTIRELRVQVDELERQIAAAESTILALRGDAADQNAKVARPDATIVSITDNGTKAYLDIGRNQKLSLGTTFSVFPEDDLIRLEEDPEIEPKAVIEVFELFENSATARVVQQQRGQRLVVGDHAINVVFDPNRTFKFFVFGDFDIRNTGNPQPQDIENIRARIRQWDSEIADEVDYDVDYLVLGVAPELPRELTGAERSDPIRIQEYNAALRKFNTFTELRNQATEYNIPILNQNDFLDLIGYYER